MDQSITLKIAGKEYPLKATSPEMEQMMRLAAEDVNAMLVKFDAKFPDKPVADKLAFVAIQEAVSKINAQRKASRVVEEVTALQNDLASYLDGMQDK